MKTRPGRVEGTIVHGDGRGRGLGFPTANIVASIAEIDDGIYAAWARIDGGPWCQATVSIGDNPTFPGERTRRVECHVHDLEADLYGCRLEVELVVRLREMTAFGDPDELAIQGLDDVRASREVLLHARMPRS